MARVTVEDCILEVPNRFELVMLASQRARRIGSGAALTLPRDNDKNPVIALREIAEKTVMTDDLREDLVKSKQKVHASDDDETDLAALMDAEEAAMESRAKLGLSDADTAKDEDEDDDDAFDDLETMAGLSDDADED